MFKLSSEASLDGAITVENKFIVEYMPYADGDYVKVYLYGLSLAARKQDSDDSIARLARRLDLDEATVNAALEYWCEQGLMSRLGDDITYFSPRNTRPKIKLYDVDTYREFNRQAQSYITGRQIGPNEYNDYYALIEKLNLEWQAMVLIVKYCVDLKGENVSREYILSVARNLATDGYRTYDEVGERLDEFGVYYNDLCAILSALGKKKPDHESLQYYKKWKMTYKFSFDVILFVAQSIKRGGLPTLDDKLTLYFNYGFFSVELIGKYEEERKALYKLAKDVNKALGLYYENVDPELSTYIKPWLGLGFAPDAIVAAAQYCMRNDLKRLSDLDAVIRDFFEKGLTTKKQIDGNTEHEKRFDGKISALFKALNIKGAIGDVQRAYYTNWADKWHTPEELISFAAEKACGKTNAFAYMNALLSSWHKSGIVTVEKAMSAPPPTLAAPEEANSGVVYEKYSEEYLNSLFTDVSEEK